MNPERDLSVDVAKFDYLWPKAYPYYSRMPFVTKIMRKFLNDDILSLGHMFEKAVSVQCGLIRESAHGYDFANGDDAKLAVVRTSNYGTAYSAPVTKIHAKTGNLLVAVYERKQQKWYHFKIPHRAYKHIPSTSNIDIVFEMDGTPKRHNRQSTNWWNYEVPTFNDMVVKTP